VAYWAEQRQATLVPGLGIAAFPAISWVVGHILMSVGAPLAVLDSLAPAHRDRRLLGRGGTVVTAVLAIAAALLIRADSVRLSGEPGSARTSIAVLSVSWLLVSHREDRGGSPESPSTDHRLAG
jgi:hypothetical protein